MLPERLPAKALELRLMRVLVELMVPVTGKLCPLQDELALV